jgi:hypothetical protein
MTVPSADNSAQSVNPDVSNPAPKLVEPVAFKAVGNPNGSVITIGDTKHLDTKAAGSYCSLTQMQMRDKRLWDKKRLRAGLGIRGPAWIKLLESGRVFYSIEVLGAWLVADQARRTKRNAPVVSTVMPPTASTPYAGRGARGES